MFVLLERTAVKCVECRGRGERMVVIVMSKGIQGAPDIYRLYTAPDPYISNKVQVPEG